MGSESRTRVSAVAERRTSAVLCPRMLVDLAGIAPAFPACRAGVLPAGRQARVWSGRGDFHSGLDGGSVARCPTPRPQTKPWFDSAIRNADGFARQTTCLGRRWRWPGRVVDPAGIAPASPVCGTSILLLDDGPGIPWCGCGDFHAGLDRGRVARCPTPQPRMKIAADEPPARIVGRSRPDGAAARKSSAGSHCPGLRHPGRSRPSGKYWSANLRRRTVDGIPAKASVGLPTEAFARGAIEDVSAKVGLPARTRTLTCGFARRRAIWYTTGRKSWSGTPDSHRASSGFRRRRGAASPCPWECWSADRSLRNELG